MTADVPAPPPGGRLMLIVHQFFPQFHSGTETLCERCARAYAARGWAVDIVTSVLTDPAALPPLTGSPLCPDPLREALAVPDPPLSVPFSYDYAPGITVHAFTHSHDPRHGIPRFRREVEDPAIEALVSRLLDRPVPARAIVFHLLHVPLRALEAIRARGVGISFVATDFFAICPIGSLAFEDGRPCEGPGPGSIACVRHLSDQTGWLGWLERNTPGRIAGFWLEVYRRLGPWPRLPVHPWQNLHYLLERNRGSRRFLRGCRTILAPTGRIERSLRRAGAPARRIRRLAYGMPPPAAPRPVPRLSSEALRLCFAGQITPRKGLQVLLDALGSLPDDLDWRLDIWGDFATGGVHGAEQRRRAEAMAPRVALRGTFESGRVHEILGSYDFIVIPSIWAENLPLVLLSALQVGTPAIVSEAEGLLDAFPGGRVFGRSFPMGSAPELARILAEEIRARTPYDPTDAPPVPGIETFAGALLD